MLIHRLISALIVIAVLVPVLLWGGVLGVAALVAFFGVLGTFELARALPGLTGWPCRELTVLLAPLVLIGFVAIPPAGVMAVPVFTPLVVLLIHLLLYRRIENTVESASEMVFALTYVMIPLCHAILLRKLEHGVAWIFFVLFVACLGDVGAYFAGKRFGKRHFASHVSPSKTVEGLGGCLAGGIVGMLIVKTAAPALPGYATLLPLAVLLAIVGPTGDLFASMIKRRIGIKDFGGIMPGHGGIMDRADSLILAMPVAYYFILAVGPWS